MTETPKCPYCGEEMLDDSYTWTCPKCYSNSPVVIWDEEKVKGMTEEEKMAYAREAALHRAEPEMRPLTLEEVQKHCEEGVGATPLWMEFIGHDDLSRWMVACIPDIVFEAGNIKLHMDAFGHRYNTMWRCWPRKPTPEQMAAEKWEE
jgi:hypothetical protein